MTTTGTLPEVAREVEDESREALSRLHALLDRLDDASRIAFVLRYIEGFELVDVASALGVSQVLLSLVIAPIATELPEKFNSIIWIRQGKATLAMGNITGAMVFQSAIPVSVALLFAPHTWVVTAGDATHPGNLLAFASAGIAFLSSAAIFLPMWRTGQLRGRVLLLGGGFYATYLVIVGIAIASG